MSNPNKYPQNERFVGDVNAAIRHFKTLPDEVLGRYLKTYLTESVHNNWDGWSDQDDVHGAGVLITDLFLNIEGGLLS